MGTGKFERLDSIFHIENMCPEGGGTKKMSCPGGWG